jgi:HK97 gp10 family phage protein
MADDLQSWFRDMPYKLRRELAGRVRDIAGDLADDIKQAAPVKSGALRDSVRVRRGRNELTLYVEAGGQATTREVARDARYVRDVKIGSGDTQGIARGGAAGVSYDYALAQEFGTLHEPAQPFFYKTYNARKADVAQQLQQAVEDVVGKL